ncbi:MAG TPA: GAF domain-containing sensor histidine kinase [Actinomycetes bacterium]|nr:GAF domain-containing sensor histidine kinase [Actinomycetes bacterium]
MARGSAEVPGREAERLPNLRLDELLSELHLRLAEIVGMRDRSHALLEAIVAVGGDLDLDAVLHRIVDAAVTLAGATYGALGVIDEDAQLSEFITVGVDEATRERIGDPPSGRGILGLLIKDPRPLRLADLSQHPGSYGIPPGHPPMRSFLGVPVRVREEVFGDLYLTEKRGGGEFDEEDERVVVALATAAGVAVENARLYEQARRRERWLQATAEVTTSVLSGSDPPDVLRVVASRALEIAGATSTLIALPGEEGALVVEVTDGEGAERLRGIEEASPSSLLLTALRGSSPVTTCTIHAHDTLGRALGDDGHRAMLVQLRDSRGVRGVLAVIRPHSALPFGDDTATMLEGFAAQAAVALQLAEARAEAERLLVYEDRDRIARDLHDLVIQRLFASGMQLESLTRLLDKEEAVQRVQRVVDDLDATIREIRSAIYALQSPHEQAGSLRQQLLEVADRAADSLGFTPSIQFVGPVDSAVDRHLGQDLVAVLVEALSNVARHAKATRAYVEVEVDAQEVRLTVRDDGIGIPEVGRRSGLSNLESRAVSRGGELALDAAGGGGTRLRWTAPLA